MSDAEKASWEYVRVRGLALIPGLCCPHHDQTQSNGVKRADDFDRMLMRNPGDIGICIDNNAAFVVDGDEWRTISADGKAGVWRKFVQNGVVVKEILACESKLRQLEGLMCPPDFLSLCTRPA